MERIFLPKNKLAEDIVRIAQAAQKHNPRGRVFIVGGFIRDLLLGVPAHDADLESYGLSYSELKHLLEQLYPGSIKEVGKSFGILKAHLPGHDIDVALPRTESKTGSGYHGFSFYPNPNLSFADAARRRDFTINAILLDPLTSELIDPFNGQADIKNRTLRAVNTQSFVEDPLRVYRALHFVSRFNLAVDPQTLTLLKTMVQNGELEHLNQERVRQELQKLFDPGVDPSRGLALAKQLRITLPQ